MISALNADPKIHLKIHQKFFSSEAFKRGDKSNSSTHLNIVQWCSTYREQNSLRLLISNPKKHLQIYIVKFPDYNVVMKPELILQQMESTKRLKRRQNFEETVVDTYAKMEQQNLLFGIFDLI